ncbi:MAG: c-type cytochrome [Acidobacteriota bacterium]|nr:c-type cytochrome [Acidobacteriota bacterium]
MTKATLTTMKTLRLAAFLAVLAGLTAYLGRQMPVQASSGGAQAATQGATADARSTQDNAAGAKVYEKNCAMCHGDKRQGNPPAFPALTGVGDRMTQEQIINRIHKGKGSMPPFPNLEGDDLTALVHFLTSPTAETKTAPITQESAPPHPNTTESATVQASPLVAAGNALFQQNCSFCHGRDAAGGESGPDLTGSKIVHTDVNGSTISPIVHNGIAGTKMPPFAFSDQEMRSLVAFIHSAANKAGNEPGGRRGVDVGDLQTGNVEAGKRYFEGPGGCSKCHSPTGDLAGIASRHEGLQLEEQMLYPRNARSTVTVTLPSGQQITGKQAYMDEFTVGLRDSSGTYHSWPKTNVKYVVDDPVNAHVEQFPKYTDADIHNLMAYIQTLR